MSRLEVVSAPKGPVMANVVFLHGLGGNGRATWLNDKGEFLPSWISRELEYAGVFSVDYDASPSDWLGHSMPLYDRSIEILELLRLNRILDTPTIFVAHSMGGIVAKKLLQLLVTHGATEWIEKSKSIRGIIFLSTPHSGAQMASFLKGLNRILPLRPSAAAVELERNNAQLRELSTWFRNNSQNLNIRSRVYYETRPTLGVQVVDESSADPGLPGIVLNPVDADHFSIAKPEHASTVHLGIIEFIRTTVGIDRASEEDGNVQNGTVDTKDSNLRGIFSVLEDSPHLMRRAKQIISSPSYPRAMSVSGDEYLVPNPVWDKYDAKEDVANLPLSNRLRGHMFLSVVQPPGKHPHLKCYRAASWKACLVPFLKHPKEDTDYLGAVDRHAAFHYRGRAKQTGKSLLSVKRNEQYRGELWLYCWEFYSLVLPNDYKQDEDHYWLDLERLSDEAYPEASVNGDIVRALREHFGTGFHGIERSNLDLSALRLGDDS